MISSALARAVYIISIHYNVSQCVTCHTIKMSALLLYRPYFAGAVRLAAIFICKKSGLADSVDEHWVDSLYGSHL